MRGNAATGWGMLVGGLLLAVLISIGLYRWDASARTAEANLRPQPMAPLAATSPQPAPVAALAASAGTTVAVVTAGGATRRPARPSFRRSATAAIRTGMQASGQR